MHRRRKPRLLVLLLLLLLLSACAQPPAVAPLGSLKSGERPARYGDYRSKGLDQADLLTNPDDVWTLTFDTATIWPKRSRLPADFEPERVLEWGKDPGLGVRGLHEQGITGKGVSVAYIDQPLLEGHQGLKGIDLTYSLIRLEAGTRAATSSMHGPAVATLLAGPEIGVAPGVTLYYYAHPAWERDQTTHADALRAVIARNRDLPPGQKIRVVGYSDGPDEKEQHIEAFQEAIAEAEREGILVVHVSHPFIISRLTIRPYEEKDDPAAWQLEPGHDGAGALLVPAGGRTSAVGSPREQDAYAYWGRGGHSWAVPYIVGTLALGWQTDPDLSNEDAVRYLWASATNHQDGMLINPPGFVEMVRQNKR